MRARNRVVINVNKLKDYGDIPGYIHLGHRHLQKEIPSGVKDGGVVEFPIPLDLLRMTLPASIVEEIQEVSVGYGR